MGVSSGNPESPFVSKFTEAPRDVAGPDTEERLLLPHSVRCSPVRQSLADGEVIARDLSVVKEQGFEPERLSHVSSHRSGYQERGKHASTDHQNPAGAFGGVPDDYRDTGQKSEQPASGLGEQ